MFRFRPLASLLLAGVAVAHSALQVGDIAFTTFNGNGEDGFAFVTLVDLPPNTEIQFCDAEWSGGSFATNEGDLTWSSGADTLRAGTVVSFDGMGPVGAVSRGTILEDNSGGLSGSSEAILAYVASGTRMPSKFLAVVGNAEAALSTLAGTGLVLGTSGVIVTGASYATYDGPRTADRGALLAALHNPANWSTTATSPLLDTTAFSISAGDVNPPTVSGALLPNDSTIVVQFGEKVSPVSATNLARYTLGQGTLLSATLGADSLSATLRISGVPSATRFTLAVNGLVDLIGNVQTVAWTSPALVYNGSKPKLSITEIMYNAPGSASDSLEFLEITNLGSAPAPVGGLVLRDAANFTTVLPDTIVPVGGVLLFANNKATADTFYGKVFLALATTGNSNVLGNGGELLTLRNSKGETIDSVNYSDKAPWPTSPDGSGPSLELRDPAQSHNDGTNWQASSVATGKTSGGVAVMASPGVFAPVVIPQVSFSTDNTIGFENAGSLKVALKLSTASTSAAIVRIRVRDLGSAVRGTDFQLADTLLAIAPGKTADTLTIPVTPSPRTADLVFGLSIDSVANAQIGSLKTHLVFVRNESIVAPSAQDSLGMQFLSSFKVDSAGGSAEILAYHRGTRRLFVLNSLKTRVEVLDFSDPSSIKPYKRIDMSSHGIGATSVAVSGDMIAASIDAGPEAPGKVVFMDPEGVVASVVTVGNLPDMVTFTPDGKFLLSANEGQPKTDYTVDAEGSVSMIDVSGGIAGLTQANVSTIGFSDWNPKRDSLKALGMRFFGKKGGSSTLAEDVEPEFITVSDDSRTAWVSLQENNALARIDLVTKSVVGILPLGYKSHAIAGNEFDASDRTSAPLFVNWPVHGVYMPDAIAQYDVAGTTYIVTANEGDAREYDALEEEAKVGDAAYKLDSVLFPNAAFLKHEKALGRLAVTNQSGDLDGDGDFDQIHAFGARSITIWNATTGALVWDSKSDIERTLAADPDWSKLFNASNDNITVKNRSDNKGPEPEGIALAKIRGRHYAFVALERIGGLMVWDITNPSAPKFEGYENNRTTNAVGGDLGPEGVVFVAGTPGTSEADHVVVANEVSATVSVYKLTKGQIATSVKAGPARRWTRRQGGVDFAQPTDVRVWSLRGTLVKDLKGVTTVRTTDLATGTYILRLQDGTTIPVLH